MPERRTDNNAVVYLVGGGIASLAAAAFLIRDGDIPGHNITILEESAKIGGSLDAAGTTTDGYVMRGGRMIESKYLCTYDLFSSIPTLDERKLSITHNYFGCCLWCVSREVLMRHGVSVLNCGHGRMAGVTGCGGRFLVGARDCVLPV